LDPTIGWIRSKWTAEDDAQLTSAEHLHKRGACKKWVAVAALV
jgi:hypothetical protein